MKALEETLEAASAEGVSDHTFIRRVERGLDLAGTELECMREAKEHLEGVADEHVNPNRLKG